MHEVSTPPAPTRESVVALREITLDNLEEILQLKTTPAQEQFVAPNVRSLAQALFVPHSWYRAIYADDTPVGFAQMIDDAEKPNYYLWRFMLAEPYQQMGFGHRALDLLVAYVRARPNATCLTASYGIEEGGPGPFYYKYGFVDTGEIHDDEVVIRFDL